MPKYNGWANYATWRVFLEYFDGLEYEYRRADAEAARACVEGYIEDQSTGWAQSLALAFVSEVDWEEIAEALASGAEDEAEAENV
jgi:hypothetical protein